MRMLRDRLGDKNTDGNSDAGQESETANICNGLSPYWRNMPSLLNKPFFGKIFEKGFQLLQSLILFLDSIAADAVHGV